MRTHRGEYQETSHENESERGFSEVTPLLRATATATLVPSPASWVDRGHNVDLDTLYSLRGSVTEASAIVRLAAVYCLCVGVFTVTQVIVFMNIESLADRVTESVELEEFRLKMYFAFSLSAMFATMVVPSLSLAVSPRIVLGGCLFIAASSVLLLSVVKLILFLYILICIIGATVGIGNTLCVSLTRKLHRRNAGGWISLNSVAFTLFNGTSVVIEKICPQPTSQVWLGAGILLLCLGCVAASPNFFELRAQHDSESRNVEMISYDYDKKFLSLSFDQQSRRFMGFWPMEADVPHFRVECVGAVIMFMLIGNELILGGNCKTSDLLDRYIDVTGVLKSSQQSSLAIAYFVSILFSRICGAIYQINASTTNLVFTTYILAGLTVVTAIMILFFQQSSYVFTTGIILIGLFYGTIPPFVVQVVNRSSLPTASSTAILMVGVNIGVLIMPYVVTFLWDSTFVGQYTVFVVIATCHALCIPLLSSFRCFHYCFQE
jgi:hypothetical protein